MQGHIPAEERPIGTGGIVLPERPIPGLGDRPQPEHLKAMPELPHDRGGEMRADAEASPGPVSRLKTPQQADQRIGVFHRIQDLV